VPPATRLLATGIEPYLLSASILGILAQRLVRKLCPDCKGAGCPKCLQTGYFGRTGIYELLEIDEPMRAAVHARESEHRLRELAVQRGFRSLAEDGSRWVAAGVTSAEELLRVTRER